MFRPTCLRLAVGACTVFFFSSLVFDNGLGCFTVPTPPQRLHKTIPVDISNVEAARLSELTSVRDTAEESEAYALPRWASLCFGALLGVLVVVSGTTTSASAGMQWGYGAGGKDWGNTFENCKGSLQSPITLDEDDITDIRSELQRHSNAAEKSLRPLLSYKPVVDAEIFNNAGKNVQVNGDFGTFDLPDGKYRAKQFHFHFPSEHMINGDPYAGELQIVHQREGAEGSDGIAILSILLEEKDDAKLDTPEMKFMQQLGFGHELPGRGMNVKVEGKLDLHNAFLQQQSGPFFHYMGSLATPPCDEGIHWYVLKKPATINLGIVSSFKSRFGVNNRKLQSFSNRTLALNEVGLVDEYSAVLPPLVKMDDVEAIPDQIAHVLGQSIGHITDRLPAFEMPTMPEMPKKDA